MKAQQTHHFQREANPAHHAALVAAELRRIENQLRALGPMPRSKVAERCGESRWRDGTVQEAIRLGIRRKRLKELPLGWIAAAER